MLSFEVRVRPENQRNFLYKERSALTANVFTVISEIHTPCTFEARSAVDAYFVHLPAKGHVSLKLEGSMRSACSTLIANRLTFDHVSVNTAAKTTNLVNSSECLQTDLARLLGTPCHAFQPESGLQGADVEMLGHIAYALNATTRQPEEGNGNAIATSYLQQAFTTIILQKAQHT